MSPIGIYLFLTLLTLFLVLGFGFFSISTSAPVPWWSLPTLWYIGSGLFLLVLACLPVLIFGRAKAIKHPLVPWVVGVLIFVGMFIGVMVPILRSSFNDCVAAGGHSISYLPSRYASSEVHCFDMQGNEIYDF